MQPVPVIKSSTYPKRWVSEALTAGEEKQYCTPVRTVYQLASSLFYLKGQVQQPLWVSNHKPNWGRCLCCLYEDNLASREEYDMKLRFRCTHRAFSGLPDIIQIGIRPSALSNDTRRCVSSEEIEGATVRNHLMLPATAPASFAITRYYGPSNNLHYRKISSSCLSGQALKPNYPLLP